LKGRDRYSPSEAEEIKRLLKERLVADRDTQKRLRSQLRQELGFFISDFPVGVGLLSPADFDELVRSGRIIIEGDGQSENSLRADRKLKPPRIQHWVANCHMANE
jgi:hypothetical protein